VCPWDEPDFDRDRADVGQAAAVNPDPLVEDDPPHRLLLDEVEEVLADARLPPRSLQEAFGIVVGSIRPDGGGDPVAESGDPVRQVACKVQQQVGRGLSVRQGAMVGRLLDPEELRQVAEAV